MKKLSILLLIVAGLFLMVTPAQATALLDIGSTGTLGDIPGGLDDTSTAYNNLLEPIYGSGTTSRAGYYGATITLTDDVYVTFEFLGFEASYDNDFYLGSTQLFSTEDYSTYNAAYKPYGFVYHIPDCGASSIFPFTSTIFSVLPMDPIPMIVTIMAI